MSVQILQGDCRETLKTLPAQSVHCVVTSPPYWGLRDYGTATWEGGDSECPHATAPGAASGNLNNRILTVPEKGACRLCGAVRVDDQIGLEESLEEFVATVVGVFREVWRVLRDDGTLWLNLGDCYAGSANGRPNDDPRRDAVDDRTFTADKPFDTAKASGLKPKDLVGAPWRVALALQADGWYLRSDIIWAKPNPMPESCRDRPTSAHEHVFLMTKRTRSERRPGTR